MAKKQKSTNLSVSNSNVDLSSYNKFDETKAVEIANSLDASNDNELLNFGAETQTKLSQSSKKLFKQVETGDAGEAGEALTQFVKLIGNGNPTEDDQSSFVKFMSNLPVLGSLVKKGMDKAETAVIKHADVEDNIERITLKFDNMCKTLFEDNVNLDNMVKDSLEYIQENNTNIRALEIKLEEYNTRHIPKKMKEVEADPDNTILNIELSKLQGIRNSLEKKKLAFDKYKTYAILELPEIDLMKKGNNDIITKMKENVTHVLPIWRRQIMKFILIDKQRKIAEISRGTTETTNLFLSSSSESVKKNTLEIAEQMEQDTIQFDTIEKTAHNLRDTIKGALEIQQKGIEHRKNVEEKLKNLRDETSADIQDSIAKMQESYIVDTDYVDVEADDEVVSSSTSEKSSKSEYKSMIQD